MVDFEKVKEFLQKIENIKTWGNYVVRQEINANDWRESK